MGRAYGTTRTTLLIGKWAIKYPSFVQWNLFLQGLLGNMQERVFSGTKDMMLCPVVWSMPGGFLNVMPRCDPITREQFFNIDTEAFPDMVEHKLDSYGMLHGNIVAVDYGS